MEEVITRSATYEDALAIATFHIRAWQVAYRGQIPDAFLDSLSLDARLAQWRRDLESRTNPTCTFVAKRAGQIVGFSSVGTCRDEDASATTGELYALYVAVEAMNQGIGSALIGIGQAFLVEYGFTHATLWVLESNQRARRFYES